MAAPARSLHSRRSDGEPNWIEEMARVLTDLSSRPVREAFLRRAMAELVSFAERDDTELLALLASPAPTNVLLRDAAVTAPGSGRLQMAREEGARAFRQLLAEAGGTLALPEAARRLGITPQAVYLRRKKGTILAVPGQHGAVYPAWQFAEQGLLPGFAGVLDDLGDLGPAMRVQFFLQPQDRLGGRRPIDELKAGRIDEVRDAALEFASDP